MDCTSARLLLALRRPGGAAELSAEDAADLDRHLAGCPGCAAAARRQDGFDRAVAAAMRAVPVPAGLRERLLAETLARRGAIWRRTVAESATAAALVVVAVLAVAAGVLQFRPALDTDRLADAQGQAIEQPERAVRDFLQAQGLPAALPRDFNFALLDAPALGFEEIDGRYVPRVVFRLPPQPGAARPDFAKVYVVRKGLFRLDKDKFRTTQNSFCNVITVPDDGSGVGYVILFTTDTLDPFLKPGARDVTRADVRPRPERPAA